MYVINEWTQRYEVSIKGREPKDGEALRAGPLSFIRLKVYGHRQGAGFRRLLQRANDRSMEVFGIFCKLLEISGNQERDKRGLILNEKDGPATNEDLAFIIGIPIEQINNAIDVLCDIGWISSQKESTKEKQQDSTQPNSIKHNSTQLKDTEDYGNFRKNPEIIDFKKEKSANDEICPQLREGNEIEKQIHFVLNRVNGLRQ